jgi:hypothetical protein
VQFDLPFDGAPAVKSTILLFLLLISQLVHASESFPIGPWRIGDSRAQVISHKEYGPYNPVLVTGGLETKNAKFLTQTTTVSFVFDDADRLHYVQIWAYEGSSFKKAKDAALSVYDVFAKEYGGATIPGVVTNGSTMLDRRAFELAFDTVLGKMPKLSDDLKKTQSIVTTTVLDLVPNNQSANCKVVAQLVYLSRFDTFTVLVFQDRKDLPDRRAKSMMYVEKL